MVAPHTCLRVSENTNVSPIDEVQYNLFKVHLFTGQLNYTIYQFILQYTQGFKQHHQFIIFLIPVLTNLYMLMS